MSVNLLTEDLDEKTIPEKFRDPETGGVRVQAIVNSYNALEKKFSGLPAAPETPDDYCINCEHGLFAPDPEVNRRLHQHGFSHEQAQAVYDLAAERMVPMMRELATEFRADREVEKLVDHFGGADKWKEVSRQLLAFGRKNLPEDVLESLSSSYEGVLALQRMMQSDEPGLRRETTNASVVGEVDLQSMMRDPRYWRDKDPAYVAKVTDGFRNLYSSR
jgi:hypothetical protein